MSGINLRQSTTTQQESGNEGVLHDEYGNGTVDRYRQSELLHGHAAHRLVLPSEVTVWLAVKIAKCGFWPFTT